uniref:Plastid-encoded RNA polymerase subunit alpha n=1 Tax=Oedogonium capilliforme TaxID=2831087 RepID=A0A8E5I4V0_9CHLO|nr:RNA polymerase alpha subunit [Oedogonium capilliforme]
MCLFYYILFFSFMIISRNQCQFKIKTMNNKYFLLINKKYSYNCMCSISNSLSYNLFFYIDNLDLPVSLSCRQIVKKNLRNIYGQFYIGPFFIGQGLTIANALRRTLLSELSTLAVTSIQIQDVVHQYQTIQGLQESVFDLLLNMKDIVLKSKTTIPVPQIGYLQVQGPCIIKAKDLLLPPFIQCVDPEQYIATLSEDGILNMKFVIRQGKHSLTHVTPGYDSFTQKYDQHSYNSTCDTNVHSNKNIDSLSLLNTYSKHLIIDASFNPVIKVNFIIELLDFDQLFFEKSSVKLESNDSHNFYYNEEKTLIKKEIIILEIWTNGSISPITALKVSIQKLISVFLKIQKSKILNIQLIDSEIFYRDIFEKLTNQFNILKFKQCQTLSDFKDSKVRPISEKFLVQKLKSLINQHVQLYE